MRTDELIELLVADLRPVPRFASLRRFGIAAVSGAAVSTLIMWTVLGVRPDIAQASGQFIFWMKLGAPLCIAVVALRAAARLSRPGMPVGRAPLALAAGVLALWGYSAYALLDAVPGTRARLILGDSWAVCVAAISILSIPLFAAVIWAMKGLAPTRLAYAGASGGLFAGAVAAIIYALHCTEAQVPFFAVWNMLGMLLPTVIGAFLGPHLLRW